MARSYDPTDSGDRAKLATLLRIPSSELTTAIGAAGLNPYANLDTRDIKVIEECLRPSTSTTRAWTKCLEQSRLEGLKRLRTYCSQAVTSARSRNLATEVAPFLGEPDRATAWIHQLAGEDWDNVKDWLSGEEASGLNHELTDLLQDAEGIGKIAAVSRSAALQFLLTDTVTEGDPPISIEVIWTVGAPPEIQLSVRGGAVPQSLLGFVYGLTARHLGSAGRLRPGPSRHADPLPTITGPNDAMAQANAIAESLKTTSTDGNLTVNRCMVTGRTVWHYDSDEPEYGGATLELRLSFNPTTLNRIVR